jgi:hypothetical protein
MWTVRLCMYTVASGADLISIGSDNINDCEILSFLERM